VELSNGDVAPVNGFIINEAATRRWISERIGRRPFIYTNANAIFNPEIRTEQTRGLASRLSSAAHYAPIWAHPALI
jgi:hypothetical protein